MMEPLPSAASTVEVEVPHFKKCFFCIPLRTGLMTWGALQGLAVVAITIAALVEFGDRVTYYDAFLPVVMMLLWLAVSVADGAAAGALCVGAYKGDWRLLNVCYQVYTVKVCAYAALLLLNLILLPCCDGDDWYWRHVDRTRYYLLMGNIALGVLDLLLQGYLALLVRSQVLLLGGRPRFRSFKIKVKFVYPEPENAYDKVDPEKCDADEKKDLHAVE